MSFSGGVYTLPGPALATGEVVSATENNQFRNDVAGAFNLTFLRNGTSTATANLPMGGYKLTGLGAPTTNGDALSYGNAAVVTSLTSTALTATRVPYAGTGGLLQDASTFTFDGTTLTAGGFSTSGNIAAATATVSGNITVSGGTANGVAYLNGSKVLTTGSALTFDGTNFATTGSATAAALIPSGATVPTNGLFLPAANQIGWSAGFAEQMRLTSTGLGIGTSSPAAKLHVQGALYRNTTANNAIEQGLVYSSGAAQFAGIYFSNTFASDYNTNLILTTSNSVAGATERMRIDSSGNVGIGTSPVAKLDVSGTARVRWDVSGSEVSQLATNSAANAYAVQNFDASYHSFKIGGSERMRIDSSGNLLVGTTSALSGNTFKAASGAAATFQTATTSPFSLVYFNNGSYCGSIATSGSNTTYNTSSDYRLKENIQPMQNALAIVSQLNPVTYTWKADGSDGQGFIAHELQAVVPDCVTGEKDAVDKDGNPVYQGIDTSFLVGILTKAIQELKAELDATKAEVAALKGK